jgi:hypothetical protein
MVYVSWKDGCHFNSLDAEKCNKEIKEIKGFVTPEKVLEKAKDKNTELYNAFEWDDKKAAHKYRIDIAGNIIRSIITIEETDDEPIVYRSWEHVKTEEESGYLPIKKVMHDESYREQVFKNIFREITYLKNKAESYENAFPVMNKVSRRLEKVAEILK